MAMAPHIGTGGLPPAPMGIKIGYGLGLYGIDIAQISFSVLLMYCYTDAFHLSPEQGGLIIFLGSFVDIAVNLTVPWMIARTHSRLGRYRPFVIYGAPLFGACMAAMFINPGLSGGPLFIYALVTHLLYRGAYAAILMPHSALISRLSDDADDRAAIGSVKAVMSNLGALTAALIGIGTIQSLGNHDLSRGFLYFALIFGVLSGLSVLISGIVSRERVQRDVLDTDSKELLRSIALIFRNGQLWFVLGATLIFFVGYIIMNAGIIYYFTYVMKVPGDARVALAGIAIGGLFMPPLWAALIRRTSKATVWAIGCFVLAALLALNYVVGSAVAAVVFCLFLGAGIGKCAVIMNYFALTADAVDYGHWRHGRRAEAYSFGFLSIVNKIGTAIGGALFGVLLHWSGCIAHAEQSPLTVERLRLVTCLGPGLFLIASAIVVLGFKVNAKRHREILAELG
jgi:GPH family glycoside/pentoside/hexuronide:cation symporter